jgi:hypothetical protein
LLAEDAPQFVNLRSPTLFGVAYTSRLYREIETPQTLVKLREKIGTPNLQDREHASKILDWLNKWGCRIKKSEMPSIAVSLAKWSQGRRQEFPRCDLHELDYQDLNALTEAFQGLLDIRKSGQKISKFGPTTASKVLFLVCPNAAILWDDAIRKAFKLAGSAPEHYREMLVHSRREAATLIADASRCGISDYRKIPKAVGSQAVTIPELLDEYHWVTITRRHTIPTSDDLKQWSAWADCRNDRVPARLPGVP